MKFKINHIPKSSKGITFTEPSLTEQNHRQECEINCIVAKYKRTGILPDMFSRIREGHYGDFSKVNDYHHAMNQVAEASEAFYELPAEIRKKFDNDPAKMLDYVDDPNNYDACVEMGIYPPRESVKIDPNLAPPVRDHEQKDSEA